MADGTVVLNRPGTAGNALKKFSEAGCKGISQVLLIDNALTGFFVLLAITLSSVPLGSIVLISSITGTATAIFAGADKSDVEKRAVRL